MGDVTDLTQFKATKRVEYCYSCPCDHQTFVLRPDAKIECGHCGTIQERLIWGQYFVSPSGGIDASPAA